MSSSRFVLHLDVAARKAMMQRIQDILDEYTATDEERRTENQTRLSGLFVLHRLPNAD